MKDNKRLNKEPVLQQLTEEDFSLPDEELIVRICEIQISLVGDWVDEEDPAFEILETRNVGKSMFIKYQLGEHEGSAPVIKQQDRYYVEGAY